MPSPIENKIEADDITIDGLLKGEKFVIDYFQREYRWEKKHITKLIEDLTSAFLKSYNENDELKAVENYQSYYMGPVVLSTDVKSAKKSIIDGQQRITSITLLLIYLNNLQNEHQSKVPIEELIFSEKFGEKSFNMSNEDRENCLKGLFDKGEYDLQDNDNETVKNMRERYDDIESNFPEEIKEKALPYFIWWLIEKVIFVKITAYSEENAYTIFETMNDRGLSLTPTEMLKAYVLSRIDDRKKIDEIDNIWKQNIQSLNKFDDNKNADQGFFQALFRGKYAETFRPSKVGSENQDFEKIGTYFHIWFKDNHEEKLGIKDSDFYLFFTQQFPFYVKWYLKILEAQRKYDKQIPHLNYVSYCGIAESLREPMLLASINFDDNEETIQKKLNFVARYIETFTVIRIVNYKNIGQSSIKLTMFNIVKKIRNNDVNTLGKNLAESVSEISPSWDGILTFGLHGQNKKYVKHLLSRISSYIDSLGGKDTNYETYQNPSGKPFEIEHIWADKFEEHKDEFPQENAFKARRNSIGDLILLPKGTNQSFGSDKYEEKLKHYYRENSYAQTLNPLFYENNPNFLNLPEFKKLKFKQYPQFKGKDILERAELVKRICEQIWSTEYYVVNSQEQQ